jgi:hypothetical protein
MLPNLIVIGAQKAGTSSLHEYLDLHPEIAMSKPKELNFFNRPDCGSAEQLERYETFFTENAAIRGESSPSYTSFPEVDGVPERMSSVIPRAKLVYLVRDPFERLVSEYLHYRIRGYEGRQLERALAEGPLEANRYVAKSSYATQLDRFLEHFPTDRILVLAQEDLMSRRRETIARVLAFLDVDESFSSTGYERFHHETRHFYFPRLRRMASPLLRTAPSGAIKRQGRGLVRIDAILSRRAQRPAMPPGVTERLTDHFTDQARRLRQATGEPFGDWSV